MSVQALCSEATVECFDERIVGRPSRPREVQRDTALVSPQIQIARDKLGALVDPDRGRQSNRWPELFPTPRRHRHRERRNAAPTPARSARTYQRSSARATCCRARSKLSSEVMEIDAKSSRMPFPFQRSLKNEFGTTPRKPCIRAACSVFLMLMIVFPNSVHPQINIRYELSRVVSKAGLIIQENR